MRIVAALCASVLLLAGCGEPDDKPDPAPSTSTPTPAAPVASEEPATVVDIEIKDGKATPQGERVEVEVGEEVTLQVRTDVDEEIHVHSDPEHTYQVSPGKAIIESFTIDTPGQVAVEAHHLGVTIVQLVVRP